MHYSLLSVSHMTKGLFLQEDIRPNNNNNKAILLFLNLFGQLKLYHKQLMMSRSKGREKCNYAQAPVEMLQRPLVPSVFLHFLNGFCLMTAGLQTPDPLHLCFLTHALATPAGLKPQGLLAL